RELIELRNPGINEKLSKGDLVYKETKIGSHKGYPYYTIGQRKGLNVAVGKRIYVTKIDSENNVVFVDDEEMLYSSEFVTNEINLMALNLIDRPLSVKVKIRYNDVGHNAIIEQTDEQRINVKFDSPQKAITPGQSAVFYSGDNILGGGIIDKIIN
ncbi:MAG: aminomethyltransferase beta-barrel domain-containing protein, partial [bacterium]